MKKDFNKLTTKDILSINAYIDNYCKDKVKESKKQGGIEELERIKVSCNNWLVREQSSQGIEFDFLYKLIEKRLKELKK